MQWNALCNKYNSGWVDFETVMCHIIYCDNTTHRLLKRITLTPEQETNSKEIFKFGEGH